MAASKFGGLTKRPRVTQSRKDPSKPTKSLKRVLRKHDQRKRALANMPVTGLQRPLSKLDQQAKDLGIYDEAYHCLNRIERKSLVSKALSKQLKAA
jgi:hypothetical protein